MGTEGISGWPGGLPQVRKQERKTKPWPRGACGQVFQVQRRTPSRNVLESRRWSHSVKEIAEELLWKLSLEESAAVVNTKQVDIMVLPPISALRYPFHNVRGVILWPPFLLPQCVVVSSLGASWEAPLCITRITEWE